MTHGNRPHEELLRAIEELAASKAQLESALEAEQDRSRRDPLTGVLNHGAIVEELSALLARGETTTLSVVVADLDELKAINDTYGHQAGDAVLLALARTLQKDGAIVGRYGGDEFLVVLPNANRRAAECYCTTILDELTGQDLPEVEANSTVPISASLGVATYPEEAVSMADLINLSDTAMYAKKQRKEGKSQRASGNARVAKLLSDILPLLTAHGTRDEKLRLVAHRLCVGVGYDAVNFEVAGEPSRTSTSWQRPFARAPEEMLEAWLREQERSKNHPLGNILERTRRPVFIKNIATTKHLTESERQLLSDLKIRSGLVVPMIWQDRVVGMLSAASKEESAFTTWDAQFLTAVSSQVTAIVFMTGLVEELQLASLDLEDARVETVMMLAAAAEAHDTTTGAHLQGVRQLSELLALELGFDPPSAREIGLASVLHDLGKIRVPDAVLGSSGKLNEAEWALMKLHTTWGGEFLANRRGFELMASIALNHHERWDGSGYPQGVAGEAIPIEATIVSVSDSFDAITNDRPYRRGQSTAKAVAEIVSYSGTQFNPAVVEALMKLHKRKMLPTARRSSHAEQAA
jgi:diguanylate cyclase (GGDEF)-like protein